MQENKSPFLVRYFAQEVAEAYPENRSGQR